MELRELAKELVERVNNEFDSILVVESASKKGTGKSTFSMLLAKEICDIIGFKFDLKEIVVFDPTSSKVIDLVKEKPIGYPIIVDEAGRIAYKRNWYKEYQKQLVLFLNLCRKYKKIIILNHPTFWQLDNHIIQTADYRVTILKRGIALIRGKANNPETNDPWMKMLSEKLFEKYCKNMLDINESIAAVKKMPNFLYEIHFGTVDKKLYEEYFKMSKEEEIKGFYEGMRNKWYYGFEGLVFLLKVYEAMFNLPKLGYRDILYFVNLASKLNFGKEMFDRAEIIDKFQEAKKIMEYELKTQFLPFFIGKIEKKYKKSKKEVEFCSDYKKIISRLPNVFMPFENKEIVLKMIESGKNDTANEMVVENGSGAESSEGTEESL